MSRRDKARERAAQEQAERERQRRADREARRTAEREASIRGAVAAEERRSAALLAPTFGAVVADHSARSSRATTALIARVTESADAAAREQSKRVSCDGCTARKGCCKIPVIAFVHEAVPIAARLVAEERDTPGLRSALEAAADEMERTSRDDYERPCVFLDDAERCAVYGVRPSECGMHFVFSDPALCSSPDPDARINKLSTSLDEIPAKLEEAFVADAGLRREDFPYIGFLPRMVLMCLDAWHRRDYVDFLAVRGRAAAERFRSIASR